MVYIVFIINCLTLRPDGGNIHSMVNIIMGLTSKTFNYIESHQDDLSVGKGVMQFDDKSDIKISMLHFMSDCMRINRPCIFTDLASNWNLTEMLNENKEPVEQVM